MEKYSLNREREREEGKEGRESEGKFHNSRRSRNTNYDFSRMYPSANVLYKKGSFELFSNFTLHFLSVFIRLPHHTQRRLYKLLLISIGYGQLVTLCNNNKQYFNYTYWIMSQGERERESLFIRNYHYQPTSL